MIDCPSIDIHQKYTKVILMRKAYSWTVMEYIYLVIYLSSCLIKILLKTQLKQDQAKHSKVTK